MARALGALEISVFQGLSRETSGTDDDVSESSSTTVSNFRRHRARAGPRLASLQDLAAPPVRRRPCASPATADHARRANENWKQ